MKTLILGMLAETHVHPGAGQREGAVDLPVARERTTDYPFVPGSGVKGAVRELAERTLGGTEDDNRRIKRLYGAPEKAGDLSFTDARLLLLPVRSLATATVWLTCPHLIERYGRDLERAGLDEVPAIEAPGEHRFLGPKSLGERLFLEERLFTRAGELPAGLVETLRPLFGDSPAAARLAERLVIVRDDDFAWFARYALPVHARNVLDDRTKVSTNLWYEESLAPDTLLYTLVVCRDEEAAQHLRDLFFGAGGRPYLQLGGNETVGQGWFRLAEVEA